MKTVSFRADDELLNFLERESEKRHLPISTTAQVLLVEYAEELGELGDPAEPAGDSATVEEDDSGTVDDDTASVGDSGDYSGDLTEIEGIGEVPPGLSVEAREMLSKHRGEIELRDGHEAGYGCRIPDDESLANAGKVRWVRRLDTLAKNLYRWHESDSPYPDAGESAEYVGAKR